MAGRNGRRLPAANTTATTSKAAASRSQTTDTGEARTSSTSRSESEATKRQRRLLRRRRLQGRRRRRTRGRRRRRLRRLRRRRSGLQGGGRRLRAANPRRRRAPISDAIADVARRQPRRRLRRHRRPDRSSGRRRSTPDARASSTPSASTSTKRPRSPASCPAPTRSRSTSAPTLGGDEPARPATPRSCSARCPANSVAAFASAEFGKQLRRRRSTSIDEEGIPGQVPPHQLKKTLKQAGIDLEKIAASLGDVGRLRRQATAKRRLGGALVIEADRRDRGHEHGRPTSALLLRANRHPRRHRRSAARRAASRSAAPNSAPSRWSSPPRASRIAIGYGLAGDPGRARPGVGRDPRRRPGLQAKPLDALGGTPISGFVDGPPALQLAEGAGPRRRKGRLRRSDALPDKIDLPGARLRSRGRRRPGEADRRSDRLGRRRWPPASASTCWRSPAGAGAGAPSAPGRAGLHRGRARLRRGPRPPRPPPGRPLRRQGGRGQGARALRRLRPARGRGRRRRAAHRAALGPRRRGGRRASGSRSR